MLIPKVYSDPTQCFRIFKNKVSWANPDTLEECHEHLETLKRKYNNGFLIDQVPVRFLNPEFCEMLIRYGLPSVKALGFYTPPNDIQPVHLDNSRFHRKWALNWSFGSDDHVMKWYRFKEGVSDEFMREKIANASIRPSHMGQSYNFSAMNANGLEEMTQTKFLEDTPTLCAIGSIHRAENYGNTGRWTISIRDGQIGTPGRDWEWIIQKLGDLI